MTHNQLVRELLALDPMPEIYKRKPTKCCKAQHKPLTAKQRREVERLSTERGYRRFVAEMTSI